MFTTSPFYLLLCAIACWVNISTTAYILHPPLGLIVSHLPIPSELGLSNNNNNVNNTHYTQDDKDKNQTNAWQLAQPVGVEVRIRCTQDSDCIDDSDSADSADPNLLMYCDRHYGFCDYFKQMNELCRHDEQCDSGLICMYGRCQKPVEKGHKGARCKDSSECKPGLCCAQQHAERICKPKLKQGQVCFVPRGGLNWSLNELCPCDEGFECAPVKSANQNSTVVRRKHMRCIKRNEVKNGNKME